MAERQGISGSSVQRIWRRHGLQPHRMRLFQLSNDPQFATCHQVVGFYADPPADAVVLSIDEESTISRPLDRTQPGPSCRPGLFPCSWCAMETLTRPDLPADYAICDTSKLAWAGGVAG